MKVEKKVIIYHIRKNYGAALEMSVAKKEKSS